MADYIASKFIWHHKACTYDALGILAAVAPCLNAPIRVACVPLPPPWSPHGCCLREKVAPGLINQRPRDRIIYFN